MKKERQYNKELVYKANYARIILQLERTLLSKTKDIELKEYIGELTFNLDNQRIVVKCNKESRAEIMDKVLYKAKKVVPSLIRSSLCFQRGYFGKPVNHS